MKHRILSTLLALALLCTLLPAAALPASAKKYYGTFDDNLSWTLDTATGVLEITGTGGMGIQSSASSVPWDSLRKYIKTVIIGSGVRTIGGYSFFRCTELTRVTIPDSVGIIGNDAFWGCTSLTSITIPDDVTNIGDYAFYECSGLTSITIPHNMRSIGNNAFLECTGLTAVHITDLAAWCNIDFVNAHSNPLSYAQDLYLNGTLVSDLVVPDGVTSISAWAFFKCAGLTSVTIPDSVTSIGLGAFCRCTGLMKMTLPFVGGSATKNTHVGYIFGSEELYANINSVPASLKSIELTDACVRIGKYAFSGCKNIKEFQLPETIERIDTCAFKGCDAVTDLSILNCNCQIEYDKETLGDRSHVVIHGYLNSTADYYARAYAYRFDVIVTEPTVAPTEPTTVPTEPTAVPTEPTTVPTEPIEVGFPGDLNGDGDVDTVDAIRLARYLVGLVDLTDAQIKSADVNGDGDVTATDAIRLARYLVGLVNTLTPEPAKAAPRATQ